MRHVITRTGLQPIIPAPAANQPLSGRQQPTLVGRVSSVQSTKGIQPVIPFQRRATT